MSSRGENGIGDRHIKFPSTRECWTGTIGADAEYVNAITDSYNPAVQDLSQHDLYSILLLHFTGLWRITQSTVSVVTIVA